MDRRRSRYISELRRDLLRDATAGTPHYEFDLGSAITINLVQNQTTLSSAVIESNSVLMCYFGPAGP